MTGPSTSSPIVWLLTDNKPGHRNQLRGLASRLKAHGQARCHWIDCENMSVARWRAITGIAPALNMPEEFSHPDLIIAAGSATHRLLAALRRKRGAQTYVLMRPGYPLGWFDGAIIPRHDSPAKNKSTLITTGVLNAVIPMAQLTRRQNALVLVGGPSKHFDWDDQTIIEQIRALQANWPDWRWTLASSRRTPPALIKQLENMTSPRCQFRHHEQTHSDWLSQTLADSRAVWVTPDSASMVFEAVTSGVPTGLLTLTARPRSRVASGADDLLAQNLVGCFTEQASVMVAKDSRPAPLWEADRAANWILAQRQDKT